MLLGYDRASLRWTRRKPQSIRPVFPKLHLRLLPVDSHSFANDCEWQVMIILPSLPCIWIHLVDWWYDSCPILLLIFTSTSLFRVPPRFSLRSVKFFPVKWRTFKHPLGYVIQPNWWSNLQVSRHYLIKQVIISSSTLLHYQLDGPLMTTSRCSVGQ